MERVATITSASGGLGSAMVRQFAADGTRVVVNYTRSQEAAQTVAEEINSASPGMASHSQWICSQKITGNSISEVNYLGGL